MKISKKIITAVSMFMLGLYAFSQEQTVQKANTENSSKKTESSVEDEYLSEIDGVVINSPPDALPYVTNISLIGIKSEPMLNFLSDRGICVSSGSACSKGKKSHVLMQMNLERNRLDGPLRISFSRFTTIQEIDALILGITEGKKVIRALK